MCILLQNHDRSILSRAEGYLWWPFSCNDILLDLFDCFRLAAAAVVLFDCASRRVSVTTASELRACLRRHQRPRRCSCPTAATSRKPSLEKRRLLMKPTYNTHIHTSQLLLVAKSRATNTLTLTLVGEHGKTHSAKVLQAIAYFVLKNVKILSFMS